MFGKRLLSILLTLMLMTSAVPAYAQNGAEDASSVRLQSAQEVSTGENGLTETQTATPTATATATAAPTATATATPTDTAADNATPTEAVTAAPTATVVATPAPDESNAPIASPSATPTNAPDSMQDATATPEPTDTVEPTATPEGDGDMILMDTGDAGESEFEYWTVSYTDGTIQITGYTGSSADVVIPSEIDGKTVVAINTGAFQNNKLIQRVTIPASVTKIRLLAFGNCTNLSEITFQAESKLETIEDSAFDGCAITQIDLPSSVTSIGDSAFADTKLTAFRFPEGIETIADDVLNNSPIESVYIPSSVTSIGKRAFANTKLTSFSFPEGIETIADGVLSNSPIESVYIPSSVTSIGSSAFAGTNLSSFEFPTWMKEIPEGLLQNTSIESITIPARIETIGDSAFYNIKSLENVTFEPESKLTTIGDGAFSQCRYLAIVLPDSVTDIGSGAFSGCTYLSLTKLPSSLKTLGSSAFSGCAHLSLTELPNSLKTLGSSAFSSCNSIKEITIPDGVEVIGGSAFSSCSALQSVQLPTKLKEIGASAFSYCSSLKSITIPETVTSIGAGAFFWCESLQTINLPSKLTVISEEMLWCCSLTEMIQIPNGVERINARAFQNAFATVRWDESAVKNETLVIPASVNRIYENIIDWEDIRCVAFEGNAPSHFMGNPFGTPSTTDTYSFYVTYKEGATGFTTPTWKGYPCFPENAVPDEYNEALIITAESDSLMAGERMVLNVTTNRGRYVSVDELNYELSNWETASIDSEYELVLYAFDDVTKTQQVTITASLKDNPSTEGSFTVTIYPKPSKISLTEDTITLVPKNDTQNTYLIKPKVLPEEAPQAVIYESSDSRIVKVYSTGMLQGVNAGMATITVRSAALPYVEASFMVYCTGGENGVIISTKTGTHSVGIGKKLQMLATVENPTNRTVTWSIDVPSTQATITPKGLLTVKPACPAGTTITVMATANAVTDGTMFDTYTVEVLPATQKITFEPSTVNLFVDQYESATLAYSVTPANASTDVVWKSSNEKLVTVQDGVVTAVGGTGKATITATATDGSGKSAKCTVAVCERVQGITLAQKAGQTTIVRGKSAGLTATVTPKAATIKTVQWQVDDSAAAYGVTVKNGKVSVPKTCPETLTECTVTATAIGTHEPLSATYTFQISSPVSAITLLCDGQPIPTKQKGALWLTLDETMQLTATVTPQSAAQEVAWSSSNTRVLTVDEAGNVQAVAKGTATITATSTDGMKKTAKYTVVVGIPADDITITPPAQTAVAIGKSLALKATVLPRAATAKGVAWSVDDTAEGVGVTIKNGKLTIPKTAPATLTSVTVTAKAVGTTDDVTDTLTLNINPDSAKKVTLSLLGSETPLQSNAKGTLWLETQPQALLLQARSISENTLQLRATVEPSTASQDVVWRSSNAKVATVDAFGNVNPVGKGSATITATAGDGSRKSAKYTVVVCQPVESISLSANKTTFAYGASVTLKATVLPKNANNRAVTWSVDDPTIATVSSRGVLKLKAAVTAPTEIVVTATCDGAPTPVTESITITAHP